MYHPKSVSKERLSRKERLTIQSASRDALGFLTNYLISPENDETLHWTLFTKDKVWNDELSIILDIGVEG